MNFEVILSIVFVLLLCVFLLIKRKKISLQKILFPVVYAFLYRTNIGIKLMDKIANKYRELVKLFGYCFIGLGFAGMILISYSIVKLIILLMIKPATTQGGMALVVPFTHIPGVGYLSFSHWIIAIFILAAVHEFAHGVVARAHNIEIKSSGFAIFSVLIPLFPAAFVEPDEKKMSKGSDVVQYSILAAGSIVNLLLAVILLLALPYVGNPAKMAPFEDTLTEPIGFSFELVGGDYPASQSGLQNGMIMNSFNGKPVNDYLDFYNMAVGMAPNQTISIGTPNGTYTLTTVVSPDDGNRGFIGIKPVQNEREVKPEYAIYKGTFYWFKGLFKWLFLLNFFIGLANLLPLGIVDGGRMLQIALKRIMKDQKKANKIWAFISLMFLFMLIFGLITTYVGNPFLR